MLRRDIECEDPVVIFELSPGLLDALSYFTLLASELANGWQGRVHFV